MTDVIDKPKVVPKLSVIPRGHWRCKFWLLNPRDWVNYTAPCGCAYFEDGTALDCKRHASREVADEWAKEVCGPEYPYAYIEAVFFPGEPA